MCMYVCMYVCVYVCIIIFVVLFTIQRSDAKKSSILIPFYCLEYADRQKYRYLLYHMKSIFSFYSSFSQSRDYATHSLNIILALGYNIHSPLIDHISEDDTYTQIPFRTFRGQFAPYCMGHGKWYNT